MIGRRIPREAFELEATGLHLAQLLQATRAPAQHWCTVQPERREQPVGCFRGARERTWKDLRVRDEKALLTADGRSGERGERGEIRGVERAALLDHRTFGD